MGKVLVLYDSQSGNTQKMAEHVAAGANSLGQTEVRVKSIDEATGEDLVWCDGLALGPPTHMGQLSWKMKEFRDECGVWGKVDGRIGVAFSSEGGRTGACGRAGGGAGGSDDVSETGGGRQPLK